MGAVGWMPDTHFLPRALVEGSSLPAPWCPAGARQSPEFQRFGGGWAAGRQEEANLRQGHGLSGCAQVWPDKFIKWCRLPTVSMEQASGLGQEATPEPIAPSKCYQGPGGPESGRRRAGQRERGFQPLHPKDKSSEADL